MGVNKQILVGNVGRDPEMKTLESGTTLTTFSLATSNRRFKDDEGNPRTEWHNIVAWGKLAEVVKNYVTKGATLYVEGETRHRQFEGENGTKYYTEVHISEMEILSRKSEATQAPAADDDLPY